MFNFLPGPTHTLHVMKLYESILQFIVASNNNIRRSFEALERCKDSDSVV